MLNKELSHLGTRDANSKQSMRYLAACNQSIFYQRFIK